MVPSSGRCWKNPEVPCHLPCEDVLCMCMKTKLRDRAIRYNTNSQSAGDTFILGMDVLSFLYGNNNNALASVTLTPVSNAYICFAQLVWQQTDKVQNCVKAKQQHNEQQTTREGCCCFSACRKPTQNETKILFIFSGLHIHKRLEWYLYTHYTELKQTELCFS